MGNRSSKSSRSSRRSKLLHSLPKRFKVVKVMGSGGYGKVLDCKDRKLKKHVAIKINYDEDKTNNEVPILRMLMDRKFDRHNIVKFLGAFSNNRYLVFEKLDIDLWQYLKARKTPMRLEDVRTVMEQLARAFEALKSIGVIHTDVKANNIMLVDRVKQPFRVKLIDFGLARLRDREPFPILQVLAYRAPEVILGLPITEAVDMWSLGVVMARMVFGTLPFNGIQNIDQLEEMNSLLGPPPDHLLEIGGDVSLFFTKRPTNQWALKWASKKRQVRSWEQFEMAEENETNPEEWRACIDLLKAMLTWDEKERITPSEILEHPFITRSYQDSSLHLCSSDECTPSGHIASSLAVPPFSNIIKIHVAPVAHRDLDVRYDDRPTPGRASTVSPKIIQIHVAPAIRSHGSPDARCDSDRFSEVDADPLQESETVGATKLNETSEDFVTAASSFNTGNKSKKNSVKRFFSWVRTKFRRSHKVDGLGSYLINLRFRSQA